jgi:hypothetical protein
MAVGKWRDRFSLERIAGLVDAPGRGRPSNLEAEKFENGFEPGSATAGLSASLELPHHGLGIRAQ